MPRPTFEEKCYEENLIHQIMGRDHRIFPPGQVLEKIVGFDVAMQCHSSLLWGTLCRSSAPPGASFDLTWFPAGVRRKMPPTPTFALNLFLQVKRPDKLTWRTATEWSSWNREYFRYDLVRHQQRALERVVAGVGRNAYVAYAAPAFHTGEELWTSIEARTLVAQTNFAQARRLSGHSKYSYDRPGWRGVAHSEPTPIESDMWSNDNPKLLDDAVSALDSAKGFNAISILGEKIDGVFKEQIKGLPSFEIYSRLRDRAMKEVHLSDDKMRSTIQSFISTYLFCSAVGSTWLIVGRPGAGAGSVEDRRL